MNKKELQTSVDKFKNLLTNKGWKSYESKFYLGSNAYLKSIKFFSPDNKNSSGIIFPEVNKSIDNFGIKLFINNNNFNLSDIDMFNETINFLKDI